ncbi:MAG TPA: circularly permuted type 2 ATP-grasp protein, partial [Myxococcaceae bacterium]
MLPLLGSAEEFARTQQMAETALVNQGVTFSVYSDERGVEKTFPVCLLPRILSAADWDRLEQGLLQRVRALEAFVGDVYGEQQILRSETVPAEVVLASRQYVPALRGICPPAGVRIHVAGIDLIRDGNGTFRVLEDNLRTPSGVSYVLENRLLSKRLIPRAFEAGRVRQVNHYPARLATALRSVSPVDPDQSTVVVLTPGPYNSAYFEHSFLARQMGLELVQSADLFV